MENRVRSAEKALQEERVELDKKLKENERAIKEKEQKMQQRMREEMQRLIKEQVDEMREMQNEFQEASELMDKKHHQLQTAFEELQELYDNRPSRPEDLELVKQLQEEIVTKDNLLKKAAEDMKFYKLELINREESYNKMFGKSPNVGFMDPTMAIGG